MKNRSAKLVNILVIVLLLLLSACVTSPPKRLEEKFGLAIETAKAQQTVNPDASRDTAAVKGVDGQAGDAMFDNYRESFINRSAPTGGALNFGTSGASSSSGQ